MPCVYTSIDLRDLCMRSMNFYDVSVMKKWYNRILCTLIECVGV